MQTDPPNNEEELPSKPEEAQTPIVTWIFLWLIFLGAVLAMIVNTRNGYSNDLHTETLLHLGGNLALLSLTGDWWRLFTSLFFHVGILHLLMNAAMAFWLCTLVERNFGKTIFLCIFIVGGIWGNYTSAVWNGFFTIQPNGDPRFIVSVGASGALMALMGAVLVFLKFGDPNLYLSKNLAMNSEEEEKISREILQLIGINFLIGLFIRSIDQAAHIGGFITGSLFSWLILIQKDRPKWKRDRDPIKLAAVFLIFLAIILFLIPWPQLRELREPWDEVIHAEQQLTDSINQEIHKEKQDTERKINSEKKRKKAAKKITDSLPKAVSEDQASGSTILIDDQNTISRLEREYSGEQSSYPKITRISDDSLELLQDTSYIYLTEPDVSADSGKIIRRWELCEAPFMGAVFKAGAAYSIANTNLVASMNHYLVRVTDLNTGADIGIYPVKGTPEELRFNRQGNKLLVSVKTDERKNIYQELDLSKRMQISPGKVGYAPFICGIEEPSGLE